MVLAIIVIIVTITIIVRLLVTFFLLLKPPREAGRGLKTLLLERKGMALHTGRLEEQDSGPRAHGVLRDSAPT